MGVKFNPFTGNLDLIDTTAAAGADTQVQFNNGGNLAGSADLTWDDTGKELGVGGDINLDDGGTYATTLQLITPTANRTISFPDATGTVGLVGGSSGQLVYNNAGAYAGAPSTSVGASGDITLSLAGAASTPPVSLIGTWFSGGTSTTTKPQLLIEPTGTTSTAWSTDGTGLGVNAASAFTGRLFDFQVNGSSKAVLTGAGLLGLGSSSPQGLLHVQGVSGSAPVRIVGSSTGSAALAFYNNAATTNRFVIGQGYVSGSDNIAFIQNDANAAMVFGTNATERLRIDSSGRVGVGTTSPAVNAHIYGNQAALRIESANTDARLQLTSSSGTWVVGNSVGGAGNYLSFYNVTGNSEAARIDSSGRLLVGTSSDSGGALLQVNGDRVRVATSKTPASATDTGTAGEICWDANYVYVCTATNTWKRSALSTW